MNDNQKLILQDAEVVNDTGYFWIQAKWQYGSNVAVDTDWCLTAGGKSGTQIGDELGADIGAGAYNTDDNRQYWDYFKTSVLNFDPLAKYIVGALDAGIIDNGGQTDVSHYEIPDQINSKSDAVGGDHNITYTWEYTVDGTTFTEIPALDDERSNYYKFNYFLGSIGSDVGQSVYIRRTATDGTPTSGELNIQLSADVKNANLVIRDIVGKTIMSEKLTGTKTRIDLSGFDSGVYLIRIDSDNQSYQGKIILK